MGFACSDAYSWSALGVVCLLDLRGVLSVWVWLCRLLYVYVLLHFVGLFVWVVWCGFGCLMIMLGVGLLVGMPPF